MNWDFRLYFNILMGILFFSFLLLSVHSVRTIIRQRELVILSRMGNRSNLIEVLDVNIALLVIIFLVYQKLYLYIPTVAVFAFFIMSITRLKSGIANTGIFIGMTYVEWKNIKAYKIINDDINTLQVKFRANNRQYIMRCNKTDLSSIQAILRKHQVKVQETIKNTNA